MRLGSAPATKPMCKIDTVDYFFLMSQNVKISYFFWTYSIYTLSISKIIELTVSITMLTSVLWKKVGLLHSRVGARAVTVSKFLPWAVAASEWCGSATLIKNIRLSGKNYLLYNMVQNHHGSAKMLYRYLRFDRVNWILELELELEYIYFVYKIKLHIMDVTILLQYLDY
jgi:hypothetical protein